MEEPTDRPPQRVQSRPRSSSGAKTVARLAGVDVEAESLEHDRAQRHGTEHNSC